jgi:lysine 2,3-aminomutase
MHEYLSHDYKKIPLYKDVTPEQWNDWHWQIRNDIRDVETLSKVVPLTDQARKDVEKVLTIFRMAITPYYASLIDQSNASPKPSTTLQTRTIPCTKTSIRPCRGSRTAIPTGFFSLSRICAQ